MDQPDFIVVCCASFVMCFALLAILAGAIRLVTLAIPGRPAGLDAATAAAIASAVSMVAPGAHVVEIQEIACSPSPPRRRFG